jgi:hypothetical protein
MIYKGVISRRPHPFSEGHLTGKLLPTGARVEVDVPRRPHGSMGAEVPPPHDEEPLGSERSAASH